MFQISRYSGEVVEKRCFSSKRNNLVDQNKSTRSHNACKNSREKKLRKSTANISNNSGKSWKMSYTKSNCLNIPITFPQFCLLFLNKCCFSPKRHFFHNQTLIFNECMFRQFLLNSLFIVISSSSNLNLGFAI